MGKYYNNEEKNGLYNNSYVESYANGFYYDKFSDFTKSLIMKAKWNIGNVKENNYEGAIKEEKTNLGEDHPSSRINYCVTPPDKLKSD